MLADPGAHCVHDLDVDPEQIIAAHPRLARHTGCDDDHIGTGEVGVVAGPHHGGIEAFHRGCFSDIQRLAFGDAIGEIEQHNVAEVLHAGEQRQRPANIASADQCDFVASHSLVLSWPDQDGCWPQPAYSCSSTT